MLAGGFNVATPAPSSSTSGVATDYHGALSYGASSGAPLPQHRATHVDTSRPPSFSSRGTVNPYIGGTFDAASGHPNVVQQRHAHASTGHSWVPSLATTKDRQRDKGGTDSLPPSRSGSEAPDDILGTEEIINPLGSMSRLAEAAVERAREEESREEDGHGVTPLKRSLSREHLGSKKARHGVPRVIVEAQGLPQPVSDASKAKAKKTHVHSLLDVVDEGIVSEEEARELMAIYYQGSSHFIPCYDQQHDTWDS